ncbi:MAG: type I restriction enzyme HsdR N-terminal domain-containing protein [Saprospiraceae bacterium]|nr:type I restriction enzyme HsdR N-terminal domain-containing protein [Saprospiraceae bacterium]MBK7360576.1 type I restriction enzyme HsdR N-terminal domain-containing protein [Saprospiraceae bacterium]MBK7737493.1 type I restriction enzyme HsdR N-terminal domain-containing protein [Saprospiraceae bacterium]MBK7913927.1 type I restriction enzyme HsdR N-terminal domain-containing protein [Saprospiraceae bacterium]
MASFEFKMVDWLASLKRQLLPKPMLFDPVRKKWMAETPEETVRQCLIQYLNLKHHIPLSRMAVEKQVAVYQLKKRFDLVVYNKMAQAFLLVECKAPQIQILQDVLDQAARYNIQLKAPYLMVSNGQLSLLCQIDFLKSTYQFTQELPDYPF